MKQFNPCWKFSYRKYLPEISLFMLFAFLNFMIGCNNYYKIATPPTSEIQSKGIDPGKYVIVHEGVNVWHLNSIAIDAEKNQISGILDTVSRDHTSYLTAKYKGANIYKIRKSNPVNEVHLYTGVLFNSATDSTVIVPLNSVSRMDVYNYAKGTSVTSHVFGILGAMVGLALLVLLISSIGSNDHDPPPPSNNTSGSCPYVYTYSGENCQFVGEMFSGAIYSSIERDDYMPLPGFKSHEGIYKLKISNELPERQYTNIAELMVAVHPPDCQVLLDKNGKVQTYNDPVRPISALTDQGKNFNDAMLSRDNYMYLFDNNCKNAREQNSFTLSFAKPDNALNGKLILNAKNSLWLEYVHSELDELFGAYYNSFVKKQKKVPAEKNLQWSLDQGMPLSVYIESNDGWEFVDYFNLVGPLGARDLIMPLDLSRVKSDTVKVKLTCGEMFWEVDYAGMDFSENIPVEVKYLSPSSAYDENNKDVRKALSTVDKKYLYQPNIGNEVELEFHEIHIDNGNVTTCFLHSSGYYESIRDFTNKPDTSYLKTFLQKGAFIEFARQRSYELVHSTNNLIKQDDVK